MVYFSYCIFLVSYVSVLYATKYLNKYFVQSLWLCVSLKSDSDDKADDGMDNVQQTDSDKEQAAAAVSARTRRSTSTKVARNECSSYQANGGNRRDKPALTVVQDLAPSSDDDSTVHHDTAVRRGKRQKTSRK